jgi:choline dehydrogenase-like flavoprotein
MTVDGEKAAARKYDYIVVGGGTAGCPLAATLSTRYSVLVVERGGSPCGIPDIENADAFGKPKQGFFLTMDIHWIIWMEPRSAPPPSTTKEKDTQQQIFSGQPIPTTS